jgi:hypothetical protein
MAGPKSRIFDCPCRPPPIDHVDKGNLMAVAARQRQDEAIGNSSDD